MLFPLFNNAAFPFSFWVSGVVVFLIMYWYLLLVHAGSRLQAISGGFNGVDSLRADGFTVWSHDRGMFLPHSQAANAQDDFVGQWSKGLASVGSDGSLYWLSSASNPTYAPAISFVGNVSGAVSSRAVRLFGQATIITSGMFLQKQYFLSFFSYIFIFRH